MRLLLAVITLLLSSRSEAIPSAYRQVAAQYDIPVNILYAIAFTESAYQFQKTYQPWPWTLNIAGKAYRFRHRHAMLLKVQEAIDAKQSVDIGIMQINWRWHKHRFGSLSPALDPYVNLSVGAQILLEQYQATGDWWQAVGRYHAPAQDKRSVKRAQQYRQRVRQHWRRITKTPCHQESQYDCDQ